MFSILTRNREIVPSLEQNSEHLPSFHEACEVWSHIQIIDWGWVGFTFQLGEPELVSSGDLTTGVEGFVHHIVYQELGAVSLVGQTTQLKTELVYPLVHHFIVVHGSTHM